MVTAIAVLVAVVVAAAITWPCAIGYRKKVVETKLGNAEDRAREIVDEALKTAETKKREAMLEAKEESMRTRNELEKETKERRAELQRYERRVLAKEETLDKKTEAIERKEAGFAAREEQLAKKRAEVEELSVRRVQELERISGLTSEQAKVRTPYCPKEAYFVKSTPATITTTTIGNFGVILRLITMISKETHPNTTDIPFT